MTTKLTIDKDEVIQHEKKLLSAFANKDLLVIDELLHDNALFVYPNAATVTKAMVMDNFRHGNSDFTEMISSDEIINIIDDTAIVSLDLKLTGKYFEEVISSQFRYIRVWKIFNDQLKVIAVSGVPVAK